MSKISMDKMLITYNEFRTLIDNYAKVYGKACNTVTDKEFFEYCAQLVERCDAYITAIAEQEDVDPEVDAYVNDELDRLNADAQQWPNDLVARNVQRPVDEPPF